ncbi:MAG: type II toxin-antitoxin system PemK/MazF family toxin [archaeon]
METPAKGNIVLIPFPFSDLSSVKNRPCLVVAKLKGEDVILCQITSIAREDKDAIAVTDKDFKKGKLNITSYVRPTKIFTADTSIIISKVGELQDRKIREVENKLCEIFTR